MPKEEKPILSGKSEHLVNIVKAGFASTPFLGGIASLMEDYIPNSKLRRLEIFVQQLSDDFTRLRAEIKQEVFESDEFAFVFEHCLRGVAENYQKEKLEAFRAVLLNSASEPNNLGEEKEFFLSLITSFSVLHIRILKFMLKPVDYLRENGLSEDSVRGGFDDMFKTAIPDTDLEIIKTAFEDLHRYGFLNTSKDIFNTMTSSQGLQLLGNRITPIGQKFIDFITIKTKTENDVVIVDGEHSAEGFGEVTGLDIEGPAIIKPGTKSRAKGTGKITGTRIGRRED